jgi:hypothetical protein
MEDDRIKYSSLHYLIKEAVRAYEDRNMPQAGQYMSSIVNWAEERSLKERGRALEEVLDLIKPERKNFVDESLYNRIIEAIESKALDNAVILHQTMVHNALYREWVKTTDEEPKELDKEEK